MIPMDPLEHRAHVLPDGSIVLPSVTPAGENQDPGTKNHARETKNLPYSPARSAWIVTEPSSDSRKAPQTQQTTISATEAAHAIALLKTGRLQAYRSVLGLLSEGAEQYRSSAEEFRTSLRRGYGSLRSSARALWTFLSQPVWVIARSREPKQYSRLTLFLLDTVRFGGTFAALFTGLFIALNYQSFWAIVGSELRPIQTAQNQTELVTAVDETLREKLLRSPALAVSGRTPGDLLSFLPGVGPPENRIIIPKLNLNIPLVTPSYENLLEEDWQGVETDIQDALQHGVVHYPGTARPGQAGNFFVTGHSSYYPWAAGRYKTVFARLHELTVGDEYWVYYGGDKHRYVVRSKSEVKPSNVHVLDQPLDRRTATLMTCTPVGTTLRRLIVTAEEVDPLTGMALHVEEKATKVVEKFRVE
jgi:LPXTG-site transpeptidase (sortase) family protein